MTLGDRVYPVEEVTVDSVNRIIEDINNILGGLSGGMTTTTVSGTINDGSLPPNVPSGVAYPSPSPPYNPDGTPPTGRDFDRHHLGRRDVQPVKDLTTTAFMNAVQFTWGAIENVVGYGYRFKVGSGSWEDWQTTKIPYAIRHLSESESSANPSGATIYIQVLALYEVGGKFLVAQACEGSDTTDILYVSPSSITDFEQISNAFPNIPVVVGATFTNASPGAGQVAWNAHSLWYAGTEYSISASNTGVSSSSDAIYIWWNNGDSAYTTTAAGTHPAASMGTDDFIIAVNVNGTHTLAWNAIANQVIGAAYIQKASIVDLHVDTISAAKLTAATVMTPGVVIGPVNTGTPSAAGLYINGNYIGYYNGSSWATSTYWENDGTFRFSGDANNYIHWNGSALDVYTKGGSINLKNGSDINMYSVTGDIGYLNFYYDSASPTLIGKMYCFANDELYLLADGASKDFTVSNWATINLNAGTLAIGSSYVTSTAGTWTIRHVYPETDDSYDLGENTTPKRWRYLYVHDINVATGITTGAGINMGGALTNSSGASTLYQLTIGAGGFQSSAGATVLGATSTGTFSCGAVNSHVSPNGSSYNLGTDATDYWNTIHYGTLSAHSSGMPKGFDSEEAIKAITWGKEKDKHGNPVMDRVSLPAFALVYPKEDVEDARPGRNPDAMIDMLVDFSQKLNVRLEALEGVRDERTE